MVNIGNSWDDILKEVFDSDAYLKLRDFLIHEYSHYTIYPKMEDIYNCLRTTTYEDVKVVILGQDPYHNVGQAHGMSFSVMPGVDTPPSLINIFKEIKDDVGINNSSAYLLPWAKQGVLLLNSVLTVREGAANSHKDKGWEFVTDSIIKKLNDKQTPVVFLLWGANARRKKELITNKNHLILECAHPSPLSAYAGFFGCKHFSKCNAFLTQNGLKPINWET